jgi:hypothetical protein
MIIQAKRPTRSASQTIFPVADPVTASRRDRARDAKDEVKSVGSGKAFSEPDNDARFTQQEDSTCPN